MTSWLKVAAPMVLLSIDDFSIEILGLFTQNEADWTASFNSQLKGTFINDITNILTASPLLLLSYTFIGWQKKNFISGDYNSTLIASI